MYPLSDHYDGRRFHNLDNVEINEKGMIPKLLREYMKKHPGREPPTRLGPFAADAKLLNNPPANDVQITWMGHSTVLLQIEGVTLLTDPVWYQRASPFTRMGPRRFFEPPVAIDHLPPIDAVLLSHDHYDHLDRQTIIRLLTKQIPVITMLGVGKRLIGWGAHPELVQELDWWQNTTVKHLTITAAPAQHFSGRGLRDRFSTLWGSFAIRGHKQAIYFGADSGYHSHFGLIGEKLGPFDLTLLDAGAYNTMWTAVHMGPENTVKANRELGGKILMPIHWGTFALAFHSWIEPVERVIAAAKQEGTPLLLPKPGSTHRLSRGPHLSGWWR